MEEQEQTAEELLAQAQSRIAELEARQQESAQAAQALQRQAVLDYAVSAAVAGSQARDPELVSMLLRQELSGADEGSVRTALADLRNQRPYLFADGGKRPRFAAPVQARDLSREDEAVAQRYKNNPWYKRRPG